MNKFYWVHIPNESNKFFVFPEEVLFERGYIEDDVPLNISKPMVFISLNNPRGWYQLYKYDYNEIDEGAFKNMFKMI
jgi:hypothetical protein